MQALTPILPNLERFVYALVRRRGNSIETTEAARDLMAETIAQAFERFDSVRHPEALLSFCFTIATRLNRREREVSQRFAVYDHDMHDKAYALESKSTAADTEADIRLLYIALDRLPEKQREAVIMFEILGFSLKEIHEVQGGTVVAVKVRISRGRAALTRMFADTESEPYQHRQAHDAPATDASAARRTQRKNAQDQTNENHDGTGFWAIESAFSTPAP